MSSLKRVAISVCTLTGMALLTGCHCGPNPFVRQAQLQARSQWQQNQSLAMENSNLQQQTAQMSSELQTANQRLANINSERDQIHSRYVSLLNQSKNPLGNDLTQKFQELARLYPEFDFDPETGVSKFHSDILFDSGSDRLKSTSSKLLNDFARLINDPAASQFHILVVGHTDDKAIKASATKQKHPSNWHLSTNRANSVVMALSNSGVKETRMGSAGYSMFQPVGPNMDDNSRLRNRRVEIYVLAPEAAVAGWDPETSVN
ncbi:MAG: OmpA family protein [Planctomycetaceae bacterium]|nr:OmpA family protein [Planctomycetaceae bacterium]